MGHEEPETTTSTWPVFKGAIKLDSSERCILECSSGTICITRPDTILRNTIPNDTTIRGCILLVVST